MIAVATRQGLDDPAAFIGRRQGLHTEAGTMPEVIVALFGKGQISTHRFFQSPGQFRGDDAHKRGFAANRRADQSGRDGPRRHLREQRDSGVEVAAREFDLGAIEQTDCRQRLIGKALLDAL